jgi:hypothetical protein
MFDGSKIIPGLIIFLGLVTFPFLYNMGQADYEVPELQKAVKGENCVEDAEWMRANHMQLLDEWRDEVVRNGNRVYHGYHGEEFVISLQNTCMDCHTKKSEFCDRCHVEAAVSPYCWECHIAPPEEGAAEEGGAEEHNEEASHG